MNEAYVSFEVAKLLKEKGFDEPTLAYAYGNDMISYYSRPKITDPLSIEAGRIPMPTHQMAMAWLREEKHISIIIEFDVTKRGYCPYVYIKDYDCDWVCEWRVNMPMKYEEAVESALKYALENLIKETEDKLTN